ncbi:hypothetical protein AB0M39_31900 [Streptomyces sp. NPDC051907]|uniref:hypothetical protein n=1 Tax=Streptomyces sp. NPDC051907 TaxID=3155284 RepID=UPI00342FFE88
MAVRGVAVVSAVVLGVVAGVLWWWAVLRLALVPEQAGLVEGAMVAGGWGLSLLPVHVAAPRSVARTSRRPVTRASRHRRSGAGSGLS